MRRFSGILLPGFHINPEDYRTYPLNINTISVYYNSQITYKKFQFLTGSLALIEQKKIFTLCFREENTDSTKLLCPKV